MPLQCRADDGHAPSAPSRSLRASDAEINADAKIAATRRARQLMQLPDTLFVGTSQLAALMREANWQQTPLGDPARWPQSVRTIIRTMLTSRFAMWMGWGSDLTFFYNDAYAR